METKLICKNKCTDYTLKIETNAIGHWATCSKCKSTFLYPFTIIEAANWIKDNNKEIKED